jgi:hypothetical protein
MLGDELYDAMRKKYIIGHWALTILLTPFMSQAIDFFFGENPHQVVALLEVYPVSLFFSIVFSLPTFLIYLICFYFLSKQEVTLVIAKLILIIISVLGIFITQTIIKGTMSNDITIAYSISSIIVGLALKLKETKTKIMDNELTPSVGNPSTETS